MLLLTIHWPPKPKIVWNLTPSVRSGPYMVSDDTIIEPGDLVVARLPDRWRRYAAARRYIASSVPIIKRVGAVSGSTICAHDSQITVDGRLAATRRRDDGAGRPLPWWQGCTRIGAGQVFLLGDIGSASFDGRYVGVSERRLILGKAHLLWR
jgi:type IV secretory pathway protease TraF